MAAELSGDLAGFSGAPVPIDEHYDVNEAFLRSDADRSRIAWIYDLTMDRGIDILITNDWHD